MQPYFHVTPLKQAVGHCTRFAHYPEETDDNKTTDIHRMIIEFGNASILNYNLDFSKVITPTDEKTVKQIQLSKRLPVKPRQKARMCELLSGRKCPLKECNLNGTHRTKKR